MKIFSRSNPRTFTSYFVNLHSKFYPFSFRMDKLLGQLKHFEEWKIKSKQSVQALWNNYGEICRLELENESRKEKSVIVKFINPFETKNTTSHMRKVNSYEVEARFYEKYASELKSIKVADYFGTIKVNHQRLIVLEDLRYGFSYLRLNFSR